MVNKKTLFAGPFIGEFGMELFTWQGHIRKMAENYDKVIVSSRPAHEFLYRDFYDDFVPFDPQTYDCDGYECYEPVHVPILHEKYNSTDVVRVLDLKAYNEQLRGKPQKFVSYKKPRWEYNIDILIHARQFRRGAKTKVERNWDLKNCKQTVERMIQIGFKIGSVGLASSAQYIEGTVNLMNIGLEPLADYMSSAMAIVGPSAGIMHYAALCECPILTWGEAHLAERYYHQWNPLNTKNRFMICDDYKPSPLCVVNSLENFISNQLS